MFSVFLLFFNLEHTKYLSELAGRDEFGFIIETEILIDININLLQLVF